MLVSKVHMCHLAKADADAGGEAATATQGTGIKTFRPATRPALPLMRHLHAELMTFCHEPD
jgi:hypothetical protein